MEQKYIKIVRLFCIASFSALCIMILIVIQQEGFNKTLSDLQADKMIVVPFLLMLFFCTYTYFNVKIVIDFIQTPILLSLSVYELLKKTRYTAHIVTLFLYNRLKKYLFLQIILLSIIIVNVLTHVVFNHKFNIIFLFIITLLFCCSVLQDYILHYRIKKGFFGFNIYEARELIAFIIESSNDSDLKNGSKNKKLFPPIEIDELLTTADEVEGLEGIKYEKY